MTEIEAVVLSTVMSVLTSGTVKAPILLMAVRICATDPRSRNFVVVVLV